MTFFCPYCFSKISKNQKICPFCHTDINAWMANTSYEERLIHTLKHPLSEARMGAIITLGNIASSASAIPLAQCALTYPKDMVQNIQILNALNKTVPSNEKNAALKLLENHPSAYIQRKARSLLTTLRP